MNPTTYCTVPDGIRKPNVALVISVLAASEHKPGREILVTMKMILLLVLINILLLYFRVCVRAYVYKL